MDLNKFVKDAIRTEKVVDEIIIKDVEFLYLLDILKITTEALDGYKKKIFYGKSAKYDEQMSTIIERLDDAINGLACAQTGEEITYTNEMINTRGFHGMLGIITEAGELAQILGNYIETGEMDIANLAEELADGAGGTNSWYGAVVCDAFNIDPELPPRNVIQKLKVRYPEKYTDELADNRNLIEERKALEAGL